MMLAHGMISASPRSLFGRAVLHDVRLQSIIEHMTMSVKGQVRDANCGVAMSYHAPYYCCSSSREIRNMKQATLSR